MADSNYYVDKNGDVWTNVLRDSAGNVISAIEVDPTTGNAGTVPRIFIGNPGLSPIPATGSDTFFAWKQGEGSTYYGGTAANNTSITPKTSPANSAFGTLPPVQTGLNNPITAPIINYSTPATSPAQPPLQTGLDGQAAIANVAGSPANANTRFIGENAIANVPVSEATPIPGQTAQTVTIGTQPVTIALPGSAVNSNVSANPSLGNVNILPNISAPVATPTRAESFNNAGGVNVGPASQVTLASDGNVYITPDIATTAELGSGVTQDANGRYVVTDGGVAVIPPNTEIKLDPGASLVALPGTVNNAETITFAAPGNIDQITLATEAVPQNSAGAEVIEANSAYAEDAAIQNPNLETIIANDAPEQNNIGPTDSLEKGSGRQQGEGTNAQLPGLTRDGAGTLPGPGVELLGKQNREEPAPISGSGDPNQGASPIASEFIQKIVPTENVFKGFATMTYSVSLYIMSAAQYSSMISTGIKSVKGLTLILQSGGANSNKSQGLGNFGAKRSEFFDLDFYIDDIEIKGLVAGTGTGHAHNSFEIKFTITEPYGLSFLDRLHAEVQKYMLAEGAKEENINYASQQYLMVVRFYGYDQYGNLVSGSTLKKREPTSDPDAVTEKFIPLLFTGIKFSLNESAVRYDCTAVCPQSFYPTADTHSRIPFNLELNGGTVADVLTNDSESFFTAADNQRLGDNLNNQDPSKRTVYQGLTFALNLEQEYLVASGTQQYANEFVIEFEPGSEIGSKQVLSKGRLAKDQTPMRSSSESATSKLDKSQDKIIKDSKKYSLPAGTSIIQAIEMVIRNSDYILSQQNIEIDQITGLPRIKSNAKQKVFQWYKIMTQVEPLGFDNITRDYAYKIKYVIARYQVNDINTPYFPKSYFRGFHKRYPYWFTGENTEVLSFSQEFNYLYFQQFGSGLNDIAGKVRPEINTIHVAKRFYLPRSSESAVGSVNKAGEPAATAASILYSPGDLAMAELEIVGDPDWLAQSEIFYGPDVSLRDVGRGPFMTDGSLNFDASEILFSVEYNTPADYDKNGLLTNRFNGVSPQQPPVAGSSNNLYNFAKNAAIALAYRAYEVVSFLSKGSFTQRIKGTLLNFTDDPVAFRDAEGNITVSPNRRAQITQADAAGAQTSVSDITAGLGGAKPKADSSLTAVTDVSAKDLVDLFDGDIEAARQYAATGEILDDTFADFDTPPPATITTSEDVAAANLENTSFDAVSPPNTSVEPITSDTEPQPTAVPAETKDIPITQANRNFQIPQPVQTGPGYTEAETIDNVPPGVSLNEIDDDGQAYYSYKGQEIAAASQNSLDKQIAAIDGQRPEPFEEYSAYYDTRIRWVWDPTNKQYTESEFYDSDVGKWKQFAS